MYLVISFVLLLLTVGAVYVSHQLKLPFAHRILHVRSIPVAVVYGIAVVAGFVWILDLIDAVLSVPAVRQGLFRIMPGANVSAAFFWVVTLLACALISVVYCAVQFLVYKFWLSGLARKAYLQTKNPVTKVFNRIASLCYHLENSVRVRDVWVNVGHWLRVMRNILSAALLVEAVALPVYLQLNLTVLNDALLARIVKSLYMIPVVTWFVLDQIVIFLQADPTPEEPELETEENRLAHYGDYKKLIAVYDDLFGGQALISYYINESVPASGLFSGPTDEQKSRAANPELLEAVCRGVSRMVDPLPPHFVDALVDLINGKSIAVFDSLSGEFLLFYLTYMQNNLFLRRKALIVCDSDGQIKQIVRQFCEVFRRLNKSHEIWHIRDLDEMQLADPDDTDILVCTEEQLLANDIDKRFPAFYGALHDVLVIHPYDIMCRSNPFAFRFYNALLKKNAQFAFLVPENNRDMDTGLEARLNHANIELYNNFNEEAGACILCWRAESFFKTQQAFSMDLYHDFGLGYTISLIAIKNGVSRIYMHAPGTVPLQSYADSAKYYLDRLTKDYFNVDNVSLESTVVHNPIVAFQAKDLSFDIYYDAYNNLLNVAMQALSGCAEITSMVHILSRPYMLREYFADHLDAFVHNDKGMQMIVPVHYFDLKAPAVALLIRLREKGMTIEEVLSYMSAFGVNDKNVEELLAIAIGAVFGPNVYTHIYSYFSFGPKEEVRFLNDRYHYTRTVRLTNEAIYQKACAFTENNVVIKGADIREVLPVPKSSVYNRFLPQQRFSYGGKRYEISEIKNGELIVRSEESVEREKEYTNLFDLPSAVCEAEILRTWKPNPYYRRDLFRARVTRRITGYFTHIKGLDFSGDNTVYVPLEPNVEETKEVVCLRLKLTFPFRRVYNRAAAMLTVLMRGILESAAPKNYRDILVVTRLGEHPFEESLFDDAPPMKALRKDPVPADWLASGDYDLPLSRDLLRLFPAFGETNFDENNENEVNLYLIDFSENGSHILAGVAEETTRLFNVLYGYLDWTVKNPQLRHSYLRMGYHQIPEIFEMPAVYDCLQRIADRAPDVSGHLRGKLVAFDLSENVHCSFCGRSIAVSSWKFDDERIMCEDCRRHCTTERREIQILLRRAYETLENTYGIQLPSGIKIKFKSAASIRKAAGSVQNGRILGFYSFEHKEIWVERGGPEPCVLSTLMHELTHAWQHANIDTNRLALKYIEGHSTYVEIECTRLMKQSVYANFWEASVLAGDDVYAQGLRYWKDRLKTESDKNVFHHMLQL